MFFSRFSHEEPYTRTRISGSEFTSTSTFISGENASTSGQSPASGDKQSGENEISSGEESSNLPIARKSKPSQILINIETKMCSIYINRFFLRFLQNYSGNIFIFHLCRLIMSLILHKRCLKIIFTFGTPLCNKNALIIV